MRYARALCLSVIYTLLVLLIWTKISGWIIAHASATDPEKLKGFEESGHLFVFGNSLALACSVLLLARTREFSPLGRYLVPAVIAVALTFVLDILVLMVEGFSSYAYFATPAPSLLIYWMDALVPGLIVAQLFRFPRVRAP